MLKNKKTIAIIIAILAIIIGMGIYIYEDNQDDSSKDQLSGTHITFTGSDIREEKNGQIVWSLTADSIELDPKTKEINMKNLKGYFNQNGVRTDITAPEAHMTSDHKSMEMTGGIHAQNSDGATFDTDALHFDNDKKELSSKGAFTYVSKDATITGDKVVADTAIQKISVEGNAKLKKN